MKFISPIGFRWKKLDVKQKDKSHVSPQRKEKHVIDLIKMLKRIKSLEKNQKNPQRITKLTLIKI
jgi:hypothetical protein